MTTSDGTFAGHGGVRIAWRRVVPDAAPRGVVIVCHGYAEHVGRYREWTEHLAGRGLAVVALDHRGHGTSAGPRGHVRDFDEFVADVRTLVGLADGWWPGTTRLLFGHSMGGLIAFLYLVRHGETVRAAALASPAFALPPQGPRAQLAILGLLARVAPGLAFTTKLEPDALARDPEVGRKYVADPLVHRKATAAFAKAFMRAGERALAEAPRVTTPLLILQAEADRLVVPSGAAAIAARLRCEHELEMLEGYYHELLNEPEPEREVVIRRLDRWFDRWLAM